MRPMQARDEKIWQERLEKAAQQQQVGCCCAGRCRRDCLWGWWRGGATLLHCFSIVVGLFVRASLSSTQAGRPCSPPLSSNDTPQKESKAKQAERLAAAKAALTTAEQERHQMHMLRANLEMCR